MPRRKSVFPTGRKSFGKGVRINTKWGMPTSVSAGGKALRVNVSGKGTRTTAGIPGTPIRTTAWSGSGRKRRRTVSPEHVETSGDRKGRRGCGCLPFGFWAIVVIAVILIILASMS